MRILKGSFDYDYDDDDDMAIPLVSLPLLYTDIQVQIESYDGWIGS